MIIDAPVEEETDAAADFLEHYGVKGMKWGQRKAAPNRSEIRSARRDFREHAKNARGIMKEAKQADKAGDPKARAAAAKRYKKEVVDKIQTPEFKKTFKDASTYTKGETAVNLIIAGPFMPLAAASIRYNNSDKGLDRAHAATVGMAKEILRELQSVD